MYTQKMYNKLIMKYEWNPEKNKWLKKEIESIKSAAINTFKKDKRITIRLYDHDYSGIQKKAMEMGIPYQTLISGIIHRYIEGDLKVKTG